MRGEAKIWVISDTHFGHTMLTERGYRPEGWEELLIKNWNSLIGENDIVFHLGDFAVGKIDTDKSISENIKLYRKMLKGRIVLVKGNHDKSPNEWYMRNGFELCLDGMMYWYRGRKIWFTHIPDPTDGDWTFNIHGHLHGNNHRPTPLYISMEKLIDASVDNLNWRPVLLEEILAVREKGLTSPTPSNEK